ncbi:hypothetical protein R3P38DRAFT_3243261 [Favolaschia claudopus]|uniref:Uncharacterized protein n=1 Tax=Favolaschia claudopus TaxID=2862362 RepID=A0AAV9Z3L3_9AGAR
MCRWRHVRNLYTRCGHHENLPPIEMRQHTLQVQPQSSRELRPAPLQHNL